MEPPYEREWTEEERLAFEQRKTWEEVMEEHYDYKDIPLEKESLIPTNKDEFELTIQQSIDKLNEITRREGVPWKLLSGAIGLNPEVHVGWNSIIVFREESEALVLQLAARSLEEKLMRKISDEVAEKELK